MTATQTARPNPYVGPRALERGETLYGRDREVMDLLALLISERIVLLYSPSGAGKTSLIQVELIPKLEGEEFQVLPIMRVNHDPPAHTGQEGTLFDALFVEKLLELEQAATQGRHEKLPNRYIFSLLLSLQARLPPEQQTPARTLAFMTLVDYLDRHATVDASDTLVLIFDQFEEILTCDPTDHAAKTEFFAQVGAALRNRRRWGLFALREDYPGGLEPYLNHIPTQLGTTFRMDFLGPAAARTAIQQPAQQAGVVFTDTAAEKLVDDLRRVRVQRLDGTTGERFGQHVEPVQLQVVCRRLWDKLPMNALQVVEKDLEEVGNVDSALADYYAEQVAAAARQTGVSERGIRDWFNDRLITE